MRLLALRQSGLVLVLALGDVAPPGDGDTLDTLELADLDTLELADLDTLEL